MSVVGKSEGKRIHLKFESFDNGEDEEEWFLFFFL
jgi:hypothetical protein